MAIGALAPHVCKYRIAVTLGAGHALMHAPQREARLVMIELGNVANRLPAAECVAVLTGNAQLAVRASRVDIALRLPSSRGSERHHHEQQEIE